MVDVVTYHSSKQPAARAAEALRTSRHDRVLDEAARELNAKGVQLTSLAEIAARLGVSRAAMYYYVADREDLVFQCYRRAAEITSRHLTDASRSSGDAIEVIGSFIERMLDPKEPEIAARAEIGMLSQPQRDAVQGLNDALVTRLAHLLNAGEREGTLRACDAEVNARIILSLITWAPLARPMASCLGPMGNPRLAEALIATIFEGMSARREVPGYQAIDLSPLLMRSAGAFDRNAIVEAKRETLITVASRLFNRKGIDATSLEEIAAQVGATKRTVHHHLGSKQDLVGACYDRAFRIFFCIRDAMLAHPGSRLEALAAAVHALALAYPREDLSPLSPLVGYGALSPAGQEKFNANSNALANAYQAVIRQGMAEGSIEALDVEARVLMVPGLLSWLVKDDVPTDAARREHIAREIGTLVAVGLKAGS